jgi:hypothetical protein
MKKTEIGEEGACSTYEESGGFLVKNLREGNNLENEGLGEIIILKWILEKWDGGTDWIDLTQDRDRWRALVNALMNLHVP